jgi:hypothetical protein
MTDEATSPLRRRMIEDMTVRNFAADTQRNYLRAVKNLAIFLGRSPDAATAEDLRLFQLHLTETHVRPPTINGTVAALRFFFSVTVDRSDVTKPLTFVAEPRKIPVILSPEEVARFLEAAPRAEVQGRTQCRLRRGPARFRGCRAEGAGHRFQTHAAADRAGQGRSPVSLQIGILWEKSCSSGPSYSALLSSGAELCGRDQTFPAMRLGPIARESFAIACAPISGRRSSPLRWSWRAPVSPVNSRKAIKEAAIDPAEAAKHGMRPLQR